jgi:hypothetical protein
MESYQYQQPSENLVEQFSGGLLWLFLYLVGFALLFTFFLSSLAVGFLHSEEMA